MRREAHDELTPKQARFAAEYLLDLNATRAYTAAGYKARTDNVAAASASALLRNPKVAAAVAAAQKDRAGRVQVDADWVLKRLVENIDKASQAVEVLDREGHSTGEYRYEGSVVNKGLELVGRHLGMFKDKVEVTTTAALQVVEEIVDGDPATENGQAAPGAKSVPPK